jgi:UDP-glucose 4-epimerase
MQTMGPLLITGGAGFIGSHLVDALLDAGQAVRVLDNLSTGKRENLDPRAEFIEGDVADTALVRRAVQGAAGIIHLAAIASVELSNQDWLGTHRVNQTGTIAVLDAARHCGRAPVVYASSAAIYGDQGDGLIPETACPAPRTAYGADKLGSELHAAVAADVHGVPTCGLRFFNVYGPRQDPSSPYSGVISIFAARIAAGRPVTIHGDGRQVRDFIYVVDVVTHLRAALAALQGAAVPSASVFNVCTGKPTSVLDIATTLAEVAGCRADIQHGPSRAGDIRISVGDPSAAQAALGVTAAVSLRDGLASTCASFG